MNNPIAPQHLPPSPRHANPKLAVQIPLGIITINTCLALGFIRVGKEVQRWQSSTRGLCNPRELIRVRIRNEKPASHEEPALLNESYNETGSGVSHIGRWETEESDHGW